MSNFGSRAEWSSRRRVVSSYIDIEIRKYQYRLLNINTLDFIAGCIMEDSDVDGDFNNLSHRRMDLMYGCI